MLRNRTLVVLSQLILFGLLLSTVHGHVPIQSDENESLETAFEIPNPRKSWVVYSEIHEGGEGRYYKFDLENGTRLRFTLFIPNQFVAKGFLPGIVLMGPEITHRGIPPDYIETVEDLGISVIAGIYPNEPKYEGFTPSTYSLLVDLDSTVNATGTYYVVVHEPMQGGRFGMALGYEESFTLEEWILVPFSVMLIYQWEGQSLAIIIAPMLIIVFSGLLILLRRRNTVLDLQSAPFLMASLAALLFIGSSGSLFFQMIYVLVQTNLTSEALITVFFAAIPLLLGISVLKQIEEPNWAKNRATRIKLILLGAIALFFWAGLILGPILLITSVMATFLVNRV